MSDTIVRFGLWIAALGMTSCGPGLEFNDSPEMTPNDMPGRSSHVFAGVIERQQFDSWPFFRMPNDEHRYWKILRRRVRVEGVFKGDEPCQRVDIFEISWTGGATGDWNATYENERYLFLVRVENGRYHVVRDWWRSIFEVRSGSHDRLPLTDASPFWERIALMMWRVKPDYDRRFGDIMHNDPGGALSTWRLVKILRGLLRHPDRRIRLSACEALLHSGNAQDECWDLFEEAERKHLSRNHNVIPPEDAWNRNRRFEQRAETNRAQWSSRRRRSPGVFAKAEKDKLRLMTTIRDAQLRRRFCALYQQTFPTDSDHGCPRDGPPPATIVTDAGDVPLKGEWPRAGIF